jgi:putative ABC transport system permease protein
MRALGNFARNLRYGCRVLAARPGFAVVACLTLALGIGATTAMFSVADAVLWRPMPWHEPDRAVMIWSAWVDFDKTWLASGEVQSYRRRARSFRSIAAWDEDQANLGGQGEPERVRIGRTTANLFETLGVKPLIGRTFAEAEDLPNGPPVAVLGYGLWTRRYGGDPAIVGRPVVLDGRAYEIVGVMPAGFVLPTDFNELEATSLWLPLGLDPGSTDHGSHGLYGAARLAPGVTAQQATNELVSIARALTGEGLYSPEMRFTAFAVPLTDEILGPIRLGIRVVAGAVGLLLLLACVNVAALMLARAEARSRELAVRAALGAGRSRLLSELLAEGLVLATMGAVVGLVVAHFGLRLLVAWTPKGVPRLASVHLDTRSLAFTVALVALTSLAFSVVPGLWGASGRLVESLKDGGHRAGAGLNARRKALVITEVAVAVLLLVAAGLMLQTVRSLQQVDLGLRAERVLTAQISLPEVAYPEAGTVVEFYRRLLEEVREVPGVSSAGVVRALPLGTTIGDWGLEVEGFSPPPGTTAKGDWQIASDGYLESMGERVVSGRSFRATDTPEVEQVGLVNQELARRYWPGRDPVGRRFRVMTSGTERPWVTVVGVVADVRHNGVTGVVKEKFYRPHSQWHRSTGFPMRSMTLVIRTEGDPLALVGPTRAILARLDPGLPLAAIRPMTSVVHAALSVPRFIGLLLALFAGSALVLAASGVYGVFSYVVSQRTREIGIRLAIGAGRGTVLRMILGDGLTLALVGAVLGTTMAFVVAPALASLLHGVRPVDPVTLFAAGAALIGVGVAASLIPALRATCVDPAVTLRAD